MSESTRGKLGLKQKWGLLGALVSLLLLVVVMQLDRPEAPVAPASPEDTIDLIPPQPLQRDGQTAGSLVDPNQSVTLPKGGWLQVAGDDGRLAQQYRFTHLDPDPTDLPTHWIRMRQPEVELFMTGGRLVTLAGDEADAYAPRQALEEGRLIGNVVIQMYEPVNGGAVDPATADPAMTITTATAEFDNLSGRITCPGELFVQTDTEEMQGTDLRILLNDRDERIEYLEVAKLDYLLLRDTQGANRIARNPSAHPAVAATAGAIGTNVVHVSNAEPAEPFYRLVLSENVRIEQAPSSSADPPLPRIVNADSLHAIFSFKSAAFSTEPRPSAAAAPMSLPVFLTAMALAAPPEPEPEEVLITCDGPLVMTPVDPGVSLPPTPKDMRLELHGTPVRILDASERIAAACDTLTWTSFDERINLTSPSPDGVTIRGRDVSIASRSTWVQPDHGMGGIDGQGTATFIETLQADSLSEPAGQELAHPNSGAETTITWSGRVNLRFDPENHPNGGGLRSIRFRKDVVVTSPDGAINADDLEMKFERDAAGEAVPDRLIGSGGVKASSEDQTMWADNLLATLEPLQIAEADMPNTPTRRIEVRDVHADGNVQVRLADGTRTWAEKLQGDAKQESVELLGADVVIARGELIIEHGTALVIERKEGTGEWPGPGRALMVSTPPDLSIDARIPRPTTPDRLGPEDSEITWQDSVHIEFDPAAETQDAAMQSIRFAGNVAVESPDGTIAAETIAMSFVPDASGRAAPDRLDCHQRIRAHSDGQTIWADDMTATLEPTEDVPQSEDPTDDEFTSRINVQDVTATGDVQVLMKDGGRAFADRLYGDAAQETVLLTGLDVIIAREDVVIDRGRHLLIDRLNGTADWQGSGRSRMLVEPLTLTADARILPPRIVGGTGSPSVSMRTTWTDSLRYDNLFADGAGAMDLNGSVHTVVDRSELERSTLQGDSVRLEFARIDEGTEADVSSDPFAGGGRVLHKLIARGDARLESRTWKTGDRELLPKLFYIAARHITWNDIRTEAEVVGEGEIVTRAPKWTTPASEGSGPFSGPGTTRFRWSERLDLVHEVDDRFKMTMIGDVQGIWVSSIDTRDSSTITALQLNVLTHRSDTADKPSTPDAPLQLGGDMEIDRLQAMGRVHLSTPTRKVDCHVLDYNARTQVAELAARPGRMVSLTTTGASMPVQAARMTWYMDPNIDRITLEQPRGAGGQ